MGGVGEHFSTLTIDTSPNEGPPLKRCPNEFKNRHNAIVTNSKKETSVLKNDNFMKQYLQ